jgi:lysophospholipase L1-like esterase
MIGLVIIIVWRLKLMSAAPNLLLNPNFETDGLAGWQSVGTAHTQVKPGAAVDNPNDTVVQLAIPDTVGRNWVGIGQRIMVAPLQPYRATVNYRWGNEDHDGAKIILRISQLDQAGQVLEMDEISPPASLSTGLTNDQAQLAWQLLAHDFVADEQTAAIEVGFGVVGNRATIIEGDDFGLEIRPTWTTLIREDKTVQTAILILVVTIGYGLGRTFWFLRPKIIGVRPLIARLLPKELFLSIAFTLALILMVELFLRVSFGLPKETFGFISGDGLYARNATLEMTWGSIPYTVKTNSLGFRGEEISLKKPKEKTRIIALGDSVTDGFFVDNEHTYPYVLQGTLSARGKSVEVLNAAKGGGSIDKEYAILRELVVPLEPDIVVLTFVTNDVQDKSKDDLISQTIRNEKKTTLLEWLFTRTAIGELMFDLYLQTQSEFYRTSQETDNLTLDQGRYQIAGGDDYAANVEIFNQRYADTDGLILNEPFSDQTTAAIENYLFALEHLNNFCQTRQIKLIFVYSPSYSQIYDLKTSLKIRDILKEASRQLSIPFLDLTPKFREAGQNKVLHLAPIDYHQNPAGNRVMAEAIAEFLVDERILATFDQ